jgi:voltage-dependent potassium channel beta subunit
VSPPLPTPPKEDTAGTSLAHATATAARSSTASASSHNNRQQQQQKKMATTVAKTSSMVYRYLGNTGLKVSLLSFGTWLTAHSAAEEATMIECVKKCWEHGINFFDTAEIYGMGVAETILGKALKELQVSREQLVISTKLIKGSNDVNGLGLGRKHLIEGLRSSLKRLQLDYVDVVFCHRPDYEVPLRETLMGMHTLVESGLAFYWATSEWPADMITEAHVLCEVNGWHPPIAEQCQYNTLVRDRFEKEYARLFQVRKYGTTIWSPLAGGILSGKYNDGEAPAGSRYKENEFARSNIWPRYFSDKSKADTVKMLKGLEQIAKDLGCSQAQLALAWTLVNGDVSTCIFGASNTNQIDDNMKSLEVAKKWTRELEDKIEALLGNRPTPEMNYRPWALMTPRRIEALDLGLKKL